MMREFVEADSISFSSSVCPGTIIVLFLTLLCPSATVGVISWFLGLKEKKLNLELD